MLANLKAELVRKGLEPTKALSDFLSCTDKTARDKLNGKAHFTVDEAGRIIKNFFESEEFSIEYLFLTKLEATT